MSHTREAVVRVSMRVFTLIFLLGGWGLSWAESRPLILGLFPYHSPQYLVSHYEGLRRYLENRLGRPVQLETAPGVEQFMQRAIRREYDVVLISAHLGRLAQLDYGWKPVVGYKEKGTVFIVARRQGDIQNPIDLKGKTIAIQDRSMLMSLSAKKWLKAKGLGEDDLHWLETGGLASSVYSVVTGQTDAGVATQASLSMSPQAELDQLHIIGEAGNIPQLYLMASPSASANELQVLRKASLGFVQDGRHPLAIISDRDLRSMDEFAADGRSLLAGLPSAKREQTRQEKP